MTFGFTRLAPDLVSGTASFAAFDGSTVSGDMIQGSFHFELVDGEPVDIEKLKAAAKAMLMKAAKEL